MMTLQITGKHMELGEALQTHCREALLALCEKFHLTPTHGQILFEKCPHHALKITTDLSIHLGHDLSLRAHHEGDDAHTCFDAALGHLQDQIIRHKNRLDDHHKHHDNHHFHKISEVNEFLHPEIGDEDKETP